LTNWRQITKRLVKDKDLSVHWQRQLATSDLLFGSYADEAVMQAQRMKARAPGPGRRTRRQRLSVAQGTFDEGPACRFVGRATLRGRFQIHSKLFRRAGRAVSYLRIAPTRACGQALFHWSCLPHSTISISVSKRHN
jgi:hypothetical protein